MQFLFRKDATWGEKIYTVFALFCICMAARNFIVLGFFPSDIVTKYWIFFSLIISSLLYIPIFFDKNPENKLRKKSTKNKFIIYTVLFAFSFTISSILSIYSIPEFLTAIKNKQFQEKSRIILMNRHAKACNYEVKISGFGYGLIKGICVDEYFFQNSKIGDSVIIKGIQSDFGIKITNIYHTTQNSTSL